ncbi:MAG: DUF2207 domain-containing protein [Lachnospiraceae bacterium]|nr:DUF2207 domain-containing protein [Lachnospiraceae bacterium]
MNKKTKLIVTIIILIYTLPSLFMFFTPFLCSGEDENANPFDYARITEVDYKAIVVDEPDSQGKVVVTERLTFDIHAASRDNLFWELWRDLCEDTIDGVRVEYKVNSVKQILDDGTEIYYEESDKLYWDDYDYVNTNPTYGPGKWYHSPGPYNEDMRDYECVFFYVDGLYREKVVFEIEYEMYNAALKYNDCSDLYLALYSGDTIKYLESYNAQILFPNEDMPSEGNYTVTTYGTNANSFPITESTTANPGYYTFAFELDEEDLKFRPYNEYIEFDLVSYGEDKHIFTEYAPENHYTYDDVLDEILEEQEGYSSKPEVFKKAKIIVFAVLMILTVYVLFYSFRVKSRMKSKYMFYEPSTDYDLYRDIPSDLDPNFASALVFLKSKPQEDDSGIYSAILLSLARKEYIELIETPDNDVAIKINDIPSNMPVTPITDTGVSQSLFSNNIGFDSSFTLDIAPTQDNVLNNNVDTINDSVSGDISTNIYETIPEIPEKEYEPLTMCEEYYYNLLVRHATSNFIMMTDFQDRISSDYNNTSTFARNIDSSIVNIGVKEGYFQKGNYKQPVYKINSSANLLILLSIIFIVLANLISYHTRMDLAFGGYFIFGISCIVGSIYLKKQSKKYILLTQYGENEYSKWRGLYNFLNSDTLIKERTFVELPLWEKYMVYATAFGISEKVIKAISIRCPEYEESPILSNNYCRSTRFRHSGRSFRSAVRSGSSHSYSGGGGFGYGGGGRGGGGGGGGH